MKKHCIDCGKEITQRATRCGSCAKKGKNNSTYIDNRSNKKHYCKNCPKEISYQSAIYYGGLCTSCANKGKNNPMFGKHHTKETIQTKMMGKNNSNFENHKLSLSNHPNWQGGISFEPYPLGWNKTFKEQIRYRDGYTCQLCGVPEAECNRKLHVHHKDYEKQNIKPDNLISLCNSCHMKTNYNRKYWTEYFQNRTKKEEEKWQSM